MENDRCKEDVVKNDHGSCNKMFGPNLIILEMHKDSWKIDRETNKMGWEVLKTY